MVSEPWAFENLPGAPGSHPLPEQCLCGMWPAFVGQHRVENQLGFACREWLWGKWVPIKL